jgi:hypothetical protein
MRRKKALVDNTNRIARFSETRRELLAMSPYSDGVCDFDCDRCEGRCLACYYLTSDERVEMLRGFVDSGLTERRELEGLLHHIEKRKEDLS